MKKQLIYLTLTALLVSSCVVIRPGQVGVKQKIGKLSENTVTEGSLWYNPFVSRVIVLSVRTNNLELALSLPSKEGLSVQSQISILYKLDSKRVTEVIRTLGLNYETIIANIFRSAASDVCAQFFAKDMHSGMRTVIEDKVREKMAETLAPQGITIEKVLMKSIQLPPGLASSIEQKLQAEQNVMRMEFLLEQEKLEANRKIIEATGARDAQIILSEGLTEEIIKIRSIEAFNELSKSPNAKVIVTNGKVPMLIEGAGQ